MPPIRGRFHPEVEGAGRAKHFFDVLLWLTPPEPRDFLRLNTLEELRVYLGTITPTVCDIRLHVPQCHTETILALTAFGIPFTQEPLSESEDHVNTTLGAGASPEMQIAAATALACDADVLVTSESDWFPFVEEADKLGVLLADTGVLLRQSELFVRGHDVPWAFAEPVWNTPWTVFYPSSEPATFVRGIQFLQTAQLRGKSPEALEAARTLVYNRLPNLCFARDRLLFYDLQQNAAKRAGWKRQRFSFEAAYHLNFYYLLLYGGFDHVALVVNHAMGLGLAEKEVGAKRPKFLTALERKSARLAAIFDDPAVVDFTKRIGALRNFAAHRGSIMPTKLIEQPDVEPTTADLDAEITNQGFNEVLALFAAGAKRERFREILRFETKLKLYERGEVADGIVPITIDGKHGFVRPMNDTEWNFERFQSFLNRVLDACAAVM